MLEPFPVYSEETANEYRANDPFYTSKLSTSATCSSKIHQIRIPGNPVTHPVGMTDACEQSMQATMNARQLRGRAKTFSNTKGAEQLGRSISFAAEIDQEQLPLPRSVTGLSKKQKRHIKIIDHNMFYRRNSESNLHSVSFSGLLRAQNEPQSSISPAKDQNVENSPIRDSIIDANFSERELTNAIIQDAKTVTVSPVKAKLSVPSLRKRNNESVADEKPALDSNENNRFLLPTPHGPATYSTTGEDSQEAPSISAAYFESRDLHDSQGFTNIADDDFIGGPVRTPKRRRGPARQVGQPALLAPDSRLSICAPIESTTPSGYRADEESVTDHGYSSNISPQEPVVTVNFVAKTDDPDQPADLARTSFDLNTEKKLLKHTNTENNSLPDDSTLAAAGEKWVFDEFGNGRPFASLLSGVVDDMDCQLIIFLRHFLCGVSGPYWILRNTH